MVHRVFIALLLIPGTAAQTTPASAHGKPAKPARRAFSTHGGVGGGVQFKVKPDAASLRGADTAEHRAADVARTVSLAEKAANPVTGGTVSQRVFRHAGEWPRRTRERGGI